MSGTGTYPIQGSKIELTQVVATAYGANHSLALQRDGTVWSWGDNSFGQLGDGTTIPSLDPLLVIGLTEIVAVAAGENHSVALTEDGTVWV